jgi:hypothetical protein
VGIAWPAAAHCDECKKVVGIQVNLVNAKDLTLDVPEGWVVEQPVKVDGKWPIKVWCPDHADPATRGKAGVSSP